MKVVVGHTDQGIPIREVALNCSFEDFIKNIYANRNNFTSLLCCWMYMPFDMYFDFEHQTTMRIFDISEMDAIKAFLAQYRFKVEPKIVNATQHEHYSKYYTDELRQMVDEVYAVEIQKFGYAFEE